MSAYRTQSAMCVTPMLQSQKSFGAGNGCEALMSMPMRIATKSIMNLSMDDSPKAYKWEQTYDKTR